MNFCRAAMEDVLQQLGLGNILQNFVDERIDPVVVGSLTDGQLNRLGVSTIGDRARLRDKCQKLAEVDEVPDSVPVDGVTRGVARHGSSLREDILRERTTLFTPSRSNSGRGVRRKRKGDKLGTTRTWTVSLVCLADRHSEKIPSLAEKRVLNNAGLGLKRIKFNVDDDEEAVIEKISSEGEGFPQLCDCGGFEVMGAQVGSRQLTAVDCSLAVAVLKKNFSSQGKIYIRPIQKSLKTTPTETASLTTRIMAKCKGCKKEMNVRELRSHLWECLAVLDASSDSDGEELTSLPDALSLPGPPLATSTHNSTNATEDNIRESQNMMPLDITNTPQEDMPNEEPPVINSFVHTVEDVKSVDDIVQEIVQYCDINNVTDPVDVLRIYQSKIIMGRSLEILDECDCDEGPTTYITVDRYDLLKTAFEEIGGLKNINELRTTLEVQFYGEMAKDYGGPRKEFFSCILREIKDKYFEHGLRSYLAKDYLTVGVIMSLSILQNGKLPQFMEEDVLEEFIHGQNPLPCISELRDGFRKLGIYQLCQHIPGFVFLLRPNPASAITLKKITLLLKPFFSPEGSNRFMQERSVYSMLLMYLREVSSGRRHGITLSDVLNFVTCSHEEPILGFAHEQ